MIANKDTKQGKVTKSDKGSEVIAILNKVTFEQT